MDSKTSPSIQTEEELRNFLHRWKESRLGLVDSRVFEEYKQNHILGATNIPHDDLSNRGRYKYAFLKFSFLDKAVVLTCSPEILFSW